MVEFLRTEKIVVFLLVVTSILLGVWKYSSVQVDFIVNNPWTGVPAIVEESGSKTTFWYKNPSGGQKGEALPLLGVYKKRFDWPPKDYVTLNADTDVSEGLVFVTGASSNHYKEMLDSISTVQKFARGAKIIVWDIGLKRQEAREVKSLCNVEYRMFNFSVYPRHVRYLQSRSFKPLLVAETLKDHPRLFWMDSSIRFTSAANLSQVLQTGGILELQFNSNNVYSMTHPKTYKYFPTDTNKLKYIGCHRDDQSVINILLANYYNYETTVYHNHGPGFMKVARRSYKGRPLRKCKS